jgi:hypothetical protein
MVKIAGILADIRIDEFLCISKCIHNCCNSYKSNTAKHLFFLRHRAQIKCENTIINVYYTILKFRGLTKGTKKNRKMEKQK